MSETVLLSVCGEVEHPLTLTSADLAALADGELVADFHCHEGWSRRRQCWRGVRLATLLRKAGIRDAGRYVTIACDDYVVVLEHRQAEDERVLLALERDGKPLDRADGLPRLVGPAEWDCFASVKSVDRIELTLEPGAGTAERIALARPRR